MLEQFKAALAEKNRARLTLLLDEIDPDETDDARQYRAAFGGGAGGWGHDSRIVDPRLRSVRGESLRLDRAAQPGPVPGFAEYPEAVTESCIRLLKAGCPKEKRDESGLTFYQLAAQRVNVPIFEALLLSHLHPAAIVLSDGDTTLHLVCRSLNLIDSAQGEAMSGLNNPTCGLWKFCSNLGQDPEQKNNTV